MVFYSSHIDEQMPKYFPRYSLSQTKSRQRWVINYAKAWLNMCNRWSEDEKKQILFYVQEEDNWSHYSS